MNWHDTQTGGLICFDTDDGEPCTIFKRNGGWIARWGNLFSKAAYNTRDAVAQAVEYERVEWHNPHGWKRTKDLSGWYRRTSGGVISVKQATSGLWYWTSSEGGGAHGWFDSAEEARQAADNLRRGAVAASRRDEELDDLLAKFDE